ncbi:Pyridoxal-5'-phosphate-dependent enzyme family protein [Euphorbia peplus]|nr:Pyridoxal-5'-phosphate-dependent enzyme family protein [Euphorbia peplus]
MLWLLFNFGGVAAEGSAGSTAISIVTVAPAYGCKCHVIIPYDVAIEKAWLNNCQLSTAGDYDEIASVINLFTHSPQANHREGKLRRLAASIVGLTLEAAQHLEAAKDVLTEVLVRVKNATQRTEDD